MRLLKPLAFALLAATTCHAQNRAQGNVKALLISDIHFDPFRDPAQFAALNRSPVAEWPEILSHPQANSAAPAEPCPSRGVDTDWALLAASLRAEQAALRQPVFITVSGDLMGHEFDCRYKALAGDSDTPAAASAFASKTVSFVVAQLRAAFPKTPIYFALGNNDSGCGDYLEDFNSPFLGSAARDFATTLPSASQGSLTSFPIVGGDTVALPAAIPRSRVIILQDLFESVAYKSCRHQADPDAATEQIAWLRKQLAAARAAHEHVWVMAHIPAAVNVYTTLHSKPGVCSGGEPSMFLKNEALSDVFLEYADVIKLALFGHTHNDEIHLYASADGKQAVASKVVPSISPINGNAPSFLVAEVNPASFTLADYTVITAGNLTGVDTAWKETYRFTKTYGEPDFSATSLADLTHTLVADHEGNGPKSLSYQRLWFPGDSGLHAAAAHLLWPVYACSITTDHAADYRACACPAAPATKP